MLHLGLRRIARNQIGQQQAVDRQVLYRHVLEVELGAGLRSVRRQQPEPDRDARGPCRCCEPDALQVPEMAREYTNTVPISMQELSVDTCDEMLRESM